MILARYILREHLPPFLASFCVITFLFAINFILRILDSVLSKGLPIGVLLEILVLNLAWMLALSIPMACLVSALMAFGRMSADHETTAMKSAGIAPLSFMKPVLIAGVLIMIGLMAFNNWVLPQANHRAGSLLSSISRKKPQAFINSGQLIKDFPGVQLWIDRIDNSTGTLYGIQIFEMAGHHTPKMITADSGSIEYQDMGATLLLHLHNGWNHVLDKDPEKYFRIGFHNQTFSVKNVDDRLERRERKHKGDRELSVSEMLEVVEEAKEKFVKIHQDNIKEIFKEQDNISLLLKQDKYEKEEKVWFGIRTIGSGTMASLVRSEKRTLGKMEKTLNKLRYQEKKQAQYWVEIHKKFSIPVACFIFVLVGAPLGIMARAGGIGTGAIYSISFFVIYWVCLISGEQIAEKMIISPWVSMWAANLFVGSMGVWLTWAMSQDKISSLNPWNNIKYLFSLVLKKFRRKRV